MIETGVIVGVIIALGQVIKGATSIPAKFIPIINIVIGIGAGALFLTDDLKTNIFTGLVIGLTASGLFDTTKIVKSTKTETEAEG